MRLMKGILAQNRDEEKEHAVMVLEWMRCHAPAFDQELKHVLFNQGPIVGQHKE